MNQSEENVERLENVSQDNGEKIPLTPSDIIISAMDRVLGVNSSGSSSREFCQIVRLYANGTVLARVLGTDAPRLMKVSQIMVNLSYVGAKEQAYTDLRRTRESWRPGRPVEVYSRSLGLWCVGYVCKCIELRSDTRIAHGDLWFQLVYFNPESAKVCYKQVKFDKKDNLADVNRLKKSPWWEQFHQELLKEKDNYLPTCLQESLGKHVQRRSPSPQSSESTTSMGEHDAGFGLKKVKKMKADVPVGKNGAPLFHRAPSIDELPDEIEKKEDPVHLHLDKLSLGVPEKNKGAVLMHRQPSIDEEPQESQVGAV